jgi:hypothetical protein
MTIQDGDGGSLALHVVVVAKMVGCKSSKTALYLIEKSFRIYSILSQQLELHHSVGTTVKPVATSAQATVYNGWLLGMNRIMIQH